MKNLLLGLILLLLIGCNDAENQSMPAMAVDSTKEAKAYFPVQDYIKSEIRQVDSLPVGIMKYTTENGSVDSSYIKQEEFHQLAQEFLSPILEKESFEKQYSETSFFDNTTQYSSFLYSAIDKSLPVQRIDILAKPEDVVYNKVKSIYMEKRFERADSSVIQKLYWKAGQNFQISTEIRTAKPEVISRQVKVVWN
jgi:hypothetical protein